MKVKIEVEREGGGGRERSEKVYLIFAYIRMSHYKVFAKFSVFFSRSASIRSLSLSPLLSSFSFILALSLYVSIYLFFYLFFLLSFLIHCRYV